MERGIKKPHKHNVEILGSTKIHLYILRAVPKDLPQKATHLDYRSIQIKEGV